MAKSGVKVGSRSELLGKVCSRSLTLIRMGKCFARSNSAEVTKKRFQSSVRFPSRVLFTADNKLMLRHLTTGIVTAARVNCHPCSMIV